MKDVGKEGRKDEWGWREEEGLNRGWRKKVGRAGTREERRSKSGKKERGKRQEKRRGWKERRKK